MAEPSPAPQGAESRRHMLAGDVHVLLINSTGEVLFRQRQHTGYEDGAWYLPSGRLGAGESVVAAVIRMAREAIGVTIDEQDVNFCHVMHNSSGGGRVAFYFAAGLWTGEPTNMEPDKYSRLGWFPLSHRRVPSLRFLATTRGASAHGHRRALRHAFFPGVALAGADPRRRSRPR